MLPSGVVIFIYSNYILDILFVKQKITSFGVFSPFFYFLEEIKNGALQGRWSSGIYPFFAQVFFLVAEFIRC